MIGHLLEWTGGSRQSMESMASQPERMMEEWTSVQPGAGRLACGFIRDAAAAEDLDGHPARAAAQLCQQAPPR